MIEESMYVRFKNGDIRKITKIDDKILFQNYYPRIFVKGEKEPSIEPDIKRASFDIIDLIEVGDYVNGHLVLGTNLKLKWWDDELGEQDEDKGIELEGYGYIYPNSNYCFKIESVLTKEQFEANSYKVGE